MKIGFTGTREGMTESQKTSVAVLLRALAPLEEFHHGDCIGSDRNAHELALFVAQKIVIHPPIKETYRSYCNMAFNMTVPGPEWPKCDVEVLQKKDYISRNHDIVDSCEILIATPNETFEILRSGTWATIRYARKNSKKVFIVLPDGVRRTE